MFEGLKRKSLATKILYWCVSIFFLVMAASYLYILVWTLISSLKTHTEIVMDPFSLPEIVQWKNYLEMVKLFTINGKTFTDMLFNSVYFSVVCALLGQLTVVTFAYACTKYVFPGSKMIYTIILIVLTLPIYGNGGALYRLYYNLGLVNTYWHPISAMAGFNMWFLYYRAFFQNISWTYAESAMMDGADDFQIYMRVMLPQAKPIFTALFLTSWLGAWNNYESAMIYLPKLPTLPVGIYQFNQEMIYRARLDILFAACIVITIPVLVLFIAFNKILTESVSVGGIKG